MSRAGKGGDATAAVLAPDKTTVGVMSGSPTH